MNEQIERTEYRGREIWHYGPIDIVELKDGVLINERTEWAWQYVGALPTLDVIDKRL